METRVSEIPRRRRIAALAVSLAGLAGAFLLAFLPDGYSEWPRLLVYACLAALVLGAARAIRRWGYFTCAGPVERRLIAAERRDRSARRSLAWRLLWGALLIFSLALAAMIFVQPGTSPFGGAGLVLAPLIPYHLHGLAGVVVAVIATLGLPAVAGAGTAMSIASRRKSGEVDSLLITPLGPEALPAAAIRAQMCRTLFVLLVLAPVYLVAVNWCNWVFLNIMFEQAPVGALGAAGGFFADSRWWPFAVGNLLQLPGSAPFGFMLLVSDLLLAWLAAALGARLGAASRRPVLSAAAAALGGLALWVFRAAAFFLFVNVTRGGWIGESLSGLLPSWMESAVVNLLVLPAFICVLALFLWLTPLLVDWARRAMDSQGKPPGGLRGSVITHLRRWLRSEDVVPSGGCLLLAVWQVAVVYGWKEGPFTLVTDPPWLALWLGLLFCLYRLIRSRPGTGERPEGSADRSR